MVSHPAGEAEQAHGQQLGVLDVPRPAAAWMVDAQVAQLGQPANVEGERAADPAVAVAAQTAGDAGGRPGLHLLDATAELPSVGSRRTGAPGRVLTVLDEEQTAEVPSLPPLADEPFASSEVSGRHRYVPRDMTVWELRKQCEAPPWPKPGRVAPWLVRTAFAVAVAVLIVAGWLVAAVSAGYIDDEPVADVDRPTAATTVPVTPGGGGGR